jgi:hypothetical protein
VASPGCQGGISFCRGSTTPQETARHPTRLRLDDGAEWGYTRGSPEELRNRGTGVGATVAYRSCCVLSTLGNEASMGPDRDSGNKHPGGYHAAV